MVTKFKELSAIAKIAWGTLGGFIVIGTIVGMVVGFEMHSISASELESYDEGIHKEFNAEFAIRDKDLRIFAGSLQAMNRDIIIRQINSYRIQIATLQQQYGPNPPQQVRNTIAMLQREIHRLDLELRK